MFSPCPLLYSWRIFQCEGHWHYNYHLAQQKWNLMEWKWSTSVRLPKDPVQLGSNPVKSAKLRISSINIIIFFFIKVRQILGIWKFDIDFSLCSAKSESSKQSLKPFLYPCHSNEKSGTSNNMTSYLWNVLVFGNFAEVQLKTSRHLVDASYRNIFILDLLTEGLFSIDKDFLYLF